MIIDRKFKILAVNPCKADRVYTENEGIFFAAKDAAVPAMLDAYLEECRRLGSNSEHMESIALLKDRVIEYQKTRQKIPDTETDCELNRCIGGILRENDEQ